MVSIVYGFPICFPTRGAAIVPENIVLILVLNGYGSIEGKEGNDQSIP